ncbi:MAG: hypothetical protein LBK26_02725 [Rickettsiales bacterium]|jgi:hypothetical protein|nr:hypothetical protein [Rickettsiales bacterium]
MLLIADILPIIKYMAAAAIILGVWAFPAWVARENSITDADMAQIRIASWGFGWTGVGWILGLYWAVRK